MITTDAATSASVNNTPEDKLGGSDSEAVAAA
jgi:hypothetical protein